MAERRMFAKRIIDSDAFTELPPTTQALYFHLCMGADDDGFNNQIRRGMFNAHADRNDFDQLVQKRFVIPFESGVIVIKHWRMHNLIRNDRYKQTSYIDELATLVLKENGVYTEHGNQPATNRQPTGNQPEPQVREGEAREGKANDKAQIAAHMIDESSLSDPVRKALRDWIEYKRERREGYKEKSLQALVTRVKKAEDTHGAVAVVDLIEESMANRYQGITWDRLRGRASPAKSTPVKRNQFTDMELRQDYDFELIERESLIHD